MIQKITQIGKLSDDFTIIDRTIHLTSTLVYAEDDNSVVLPASTVKGEIFDFIGGDTSWEIEAPEGYLIRMLDETGIKLSSTDSYACVSLVYLDDEDKTWLVKSSIGDIAIEPGQ